MHKWNEITDENSLKEFMERVSFFHDSCIKEMHYLSGAYVNENLDMYPVNDRRILRVIIQRQYEEDSMIEISGIKILKVISGRRTLFMRNTRFQYNSERGLYHLERLRR